VNKTSFCHLKIRQIISTRQYMQNLAQKQEVLLEQLQKFLCVQLIDLFLARDGRQA
jgi:hypothetical protein